MAGYMVAGGQSVHVVDVVNPSIVYDTETDPYTTYDIKSKLPDIYSKLSVENFSILSIDYETIGGVSISISIDSYDSGSGVLKVNRTYRTGNTRRMYFNAITFRVVY